MNDNDESKRELFPQEKEQMSRGFRRLLTVLFIIVFLVVGVLLVKSASAKDRHGHGVLVIGEEVGGFTIACDTQEQLVSILEKIAVFHDLEFGEERNDVTIIMVNRPGDSKGFFITTTFPVVTKDELAIGQAL